MTPRRPIATALLAIAALALAACADLRDDFNPVRLICPGEFHPHTNKCVIQRGE